MVSHRAYPSGPPNPLEPSSSFAARAVLPFRHMAIQRLCDGALRLANGDDMIFVEDRRELEPAGEEAAVSVAEAR